MTAQQLGGGNKENKLHYITLYNKAGIQYKRNYNLNSSFKYIIYRSFLWT